MTKASFLEGWGLELASDDRGELNRKIEPERCGDRVSRGKKYYGVVLEFWVDQWTRRLVEQ